MNQVSFYCFLPNQKFLFVFRLVPFCDQYDFAKTLTTLPRRLYCFLGINLFNIILDGSVTKSVCYGQVVFGFEAEKNSKKNECSGLRQDEDAYLAADGLVSYFRTDFVDVLVFCVENRPKVHEEPKTKGSDDLHANLQRFPSSVVQCIHLYRLQERIFHKNDMEMCGN